MKDHSIRLPSGSVVHVHPPEWEGTRRKRPDEDILYYVEILTPRGSGYVYSRDRNSDLGEFPDSTSFCKELLEEGYIVPGDEPAIVEFLDADPEEVSLALSVMTA